jgi:hypothetical protein
VALGRASVDRDAPRDEGLEAEGLAEGRALQVPFQGGRRAAFRAGYAAGANDVFGGYDGGWYLGQPYVITLAKGHGPVAYRIDSRRQLRR